MSSPSPAEILRKSLNEALLAMYADGTYQQIYGRISPAVNLVWIASGRMSGSLVTGWMLERSLHDGWLPVVNQRVTVDLIHRTGSAEEARAAAIHGSMWWLACKEKRCLDAAFENFVCACSIWHYARRLKVHTMRTKMAVARLSADCESASGSNAANFAT